MIVSLLKGADLYEKANNHRNRHRCLCRTVCRCVDKKHRGRDLPAEPVKTAVTAEIEARSEEKTQIPLSADTPADEAAAATEIELLKTHITAEEKTETLPPMESAPPGVSKSEPTSTEPKPGTIAVIEGVESMWVPGFGWVKDESGGSICTIADGEGDINKQVGIMGGGTTVGNPGDELTGHKVGIMGSGDTPANSNPVSCTKKYIDGVIHVCGYRTTDIYPSAERMSALPQRICMRTAIKSGIHTVHQPEKQR